MFYITCTFQFVKCFLHVIKTFWFVSDLSNMEDRVNVDKPLWEQSTFIGRFKHFAWMTNPVSSPRLACLPSSYQAKSQQYRGPTASIIAHRWQVRSKQSKIAHLSWQGQGLGGGILVMHMFACAANESFRSHILPHSHIIGS